MENPKNLLDLLMLTESEFHESDDKLVVWSRILQLNIKKNWAGMCSKDQLNHQLRCLQSMITTDNPIKLSDVILLGGTSDVEQKIPEKMTLEEFDAYYEGLDQDNVERLNNCIASLRKENSEKLKAAKQKLLSLIKDSKNATRDCYKRKAFDQLCTTISKKDLTKEEIKVIFKNVLTIALQRRQSGFFHPANTTSSGIRIKEKLNSDQYKLLASFLEIKPPDRRNFLSRFFNIGRTDEIHYRDLRKYASGLETNSPFHKKHLDAKNPYREAKNPYGEPKPRPKK